MFEPTLPPGFLRNPQEPMCSIQPMPMAYHSKQLTDPLAGEKQAGCMCAMMDYVEHYNVHIRDLFKLLK